MNATFLRRLLKPLAAVVATGLLLSHPVRLLHGQPAEPSEPPEVQLLLDRAGLFLQEGRVPEVLRILESVETAEPDNPWLWYYRGKAYAMIGEPYRAMEAFDQALSGLLALEPSDPELVEKIRWERRAARRQVFNLSLQAGLAYDTNVTYEGTGVSEDFISGREDGRFATRVQLDFAPHVTATDAWVFGVRLEDSWHFAVEEFNFQDYGAYARYSRKLSDRWTVDLQYDYDITYLGNEPFLSNHMLGPTFTLQWPVTGKSFTLHRTFFDYRIEARDYLYDTRPAFDRDGFVNAAGVTQSFRFRPVRDRSWVWDAQAGYRVESVATQGSEFDRVGQSISGGLRMPLGDALIRDLECTVQVLGGVQFDHYRNDSLIDYRPGAKRDDIITSAGAVISQELLRSLKHGDVILHGIVHWMDSDSDVRDRSRASPYTYDKLVVGLQLEWRF